MPNVSGTGIISEELSQRVASSARHSQADGTVSSRTLLSSDPRSGLRTKSAGPRTRKRVGDSRRIATKGAC